MKQLLLLNPEGATEAEVATYSLRETARAVVFDEDNKVAILHVKSENYYKLPGGGLDGQDKITGLKRECLEEIGCDVDVVSEIGIVVECRKFFNQKQISYCYLAKVKGKKGEPSFTEEELQYGFEQLWLSFEEVKKLVAQKSDRTSFEGGAYIIPRDSAILAEASSLVLK